MDNFDPEMLLTSEQVFQFVPPEIFKDASSKDHLLKTLFSYADQYKGEVVKIIRICLGKFKKGFEKQKDAIFGFGTTANDATGSVLKL